MSLRSLRVALQFLSVLPLRIEPAPTPRENALSLLYYPVVGLLFGGLLWVLALIPIAATSLHAALLLAVWVAASGALHLDGLGDSADAWIGGRGDRDRALAIMKDPYAGPVAVTVIVLLLLLKFAALGALFEVGDGRIAAALLLPPVLARTLMPLLFASTPYVRARGLGSDMSRDLPRTRATGVVAIAIVLLCAAFGRPGIFASIAALSAFAVIRSAMLRRLGGTTGDTAGALIEIVETLVLVVLALLPAA